MYRHEKTPDKKQSFLNVGFANGSEGASNRQDLRVKTLPHF